MEQKIADDQRAPAVLRHHPKGGNAPEGEVLDIVVGKEHPEVLVDEIDHFFLEKIQEPIGGFVWATKYSSVNLLGRPRWCGEEYGRPAASVLTEEWLGRVAPNVIETSKIATTTSLPDKVR